MSTEKEVIPPNTETNQTNSDSPPVVAQAGDIELKQLQEQIKAQQEQIEQLKKASAKFVDGYKVPEQPVMVEMKPEEHIDMIYTSILERNRKYKDPEFSKGEALIYFFKQRGIDSKDIAEMITEGI